MNKPIMRIRKNMKLSDFIATMGYEGIHSTYYECQLNQSPWDAISFSPQTYPSSLNWLERSDNSDKNCGSVGAVASLEMKEGRHEMAGEVLFDMNNEKKQSESGESDIKTENKGEFLSKNSKKNEDTCVQCKKTECDHCCCCITHNNSSAKKHEKRVSRTVLARKCRASAAKKLYSSNSVTNGFYYYSGFGPLWGKNRRG